ncbi:MAG: NYN domain-containing protein [Verrucomicrobiota bacterium JB022]|nr:NYN domain-containing protein [Verrucomicrobiota bacterium JB022]
MNFCEHLLIDGYNLIHAWPELRQVLDVVGPEAAVQRLVDQVRVLHDGDQLRTSVVLDGKGSRVSIEHPGKQETFAVIYTPSGLTADAFIEQFAERVSDPENVIVATRDNALALTVFSYGGRHWDPDKLADRLAAAEKRQAARLAQHRAHAKKQWKRGLFDEFQA